RENAAVGIALEVAGEYRGLTADATHYPGTLDDLLRAGEAQLHIAAELLQRYGAHVDPSAVKLLPPVEPGKIICIGLNYADHAAEAGLQMPAVPTIFSRFASSIVG